MKIGMVLYPTFGGSGVVATELGIALAREGHEVHFITYNQPVRLTELGPNLFYHEVRVSDYPLFEYSPYELVLTSKIVDVAMHEGLDLLHVHYAIPHASAAFTARAILKGKGVNVPFITTLHGTDITLVGKDPSFEPVITFAINESDAVTAVSEDLKKDTYAHFQINNGIEVIPNFICPARHMAKPSEGFRKQYAPNKERIVMHISNFRKVKRVDDVVKVFARIQKKVPSILILVGDGPERKSIEELCSDLGIADKVFFLGKVRDVEDVITFADLFVLPSETESFGLAALEAMISRVPVISTNTGGLPEVNQHGVSGFMSNVGDVEDMAKNAIRILHDDNSLKEFKEMAFQRALDFDIANVLPLYINLYEKVINQVLLDQ